MRPPDQPVAAGWLVRSSLRACAADHLGAALRLHRSAYLAVLLAAISPLASCQGRVGFEVVSVMPQSGWVDGCIPARFSGHGYPEDVAQLDIRVGDNPVVDLFYPDAEEAPLDVGYVAYGTIPLASEPGPADLVASNGQVETVRVDGFHYLACPGEPHVEDVSPADALVSGQSVTVSGCNLVADQMEVLLVGLTNSTSATAPLTSVCGTAQVSFTAPDLGGGDYLVYLTDGSGAVVFPPPCDTSDTGSSCISAPIVTYDGAPPDTTGAPGTGGTGITGAGTTPGGTTAGTGATGGTGSAGGTGTTGSGGTTGGTGTTSGTGASATTAAGGTGAAGTGGTP